MNLDAGLALGTLLGALMFTESSSAGTVADNNIDELFTTAEHADERGKAAKLDLYSKMLRATQGRGAYRLLVKTLQKCETRDSETVACIARVKRKVDPEIVTKNSRPPFTEMLFQSRPASLTEFTSFVDVNDTRLGSHENPGVRAKGKSDVNTGGADYWHANFDIGTGSSSFGAGYELSDGNGIPAFQSSFTTPYVFNGFADKFLITPPAGLEDVYLLYKYSRDKFSAGVIFHDYAAGAGGASYGDELDLYFGYQLNKRLGLKLQYADYDADTFSSDTRKVWLSAIHNF